MRCCPRRPCHLRPIQSRILSKQLPSRTLALAHQRLRTLARAPNLRDLLELLLADLRRGQQELAPAADRLGLLELLDLRVTRGDELRLVGRVAVLALLAALLPFLALGVLFLGLALVLEAAEGLADRCGRLAGLFVRGVVEPGGGLLFEGNVCVVLQCGVNIHNSNTKTVALTSIPFFLVLCRML